MERWVVFSNCQSYGLAQCLALQNPGVNVEGRDSTVYQRDIDGFAEEVEYFSKIFIADFVLELGLFDFGKFSDRIVKIPVVEFAGYHPDNCYAYSNKSGILKSPIGDYHSIICLAAYNKGLNPLDTRALFCNKIYEAGGYFDMWNSEKEMLHKLFESCDLKLDGAFRRWTMRDSFMHSLNHPKMECIYDVAAAASRKAGREPTLNNLRPPDNLCLGAVFPVYDEIAERYGVTGCYDFKPTSEFRVLTLEQFISGSFEAYEKFGSPMVWTATFEKRYSDVFNAI